MGILDPRKLTGEAKLPCPSTLPAPHPPSQVQKQKKLECVRREDDRKKKKKRIVLIRNTLSALEPLALPCQLDGQ